MPDLSRFTALAAKNGVVPPVPPQNSVVVDESDLIDAYEERAAIMEYDGGMSRKDAEALAWAEVFGDRARAA